MRIPGRFIGFLAIFQSILFLVHVFLYETWTFSVAGKDLPSTSLLKIVLAALSVSFLAASVLAFRHTNSVLRVFYRIAAVWLGLVSFLFFAAVLSWIVFGIALLAGWHADFHRVAEVLFGTAAPQSMLRERPSRCVICAHRRERTLWRGITSCSVTIRSSCERLPAREFISCITKK
jgi:hypothetical protein